MLDAFKTNGSSPPRNAWLGLAAVLSPWALAFIPCYNVGANRITPRRGVA
jgi:hypothetical protein